MFLFVSFVTRAFLQEDTECDFIFILSRAWIEDAESLSMVICLLVVSSDVSWFAAVSIAWSSACATIHLLCLPFSW